MKYYLAMSKRDKDFIIMESSGIFRWYRQLPVYIDTTQFTPIVRDSDTVDDWLSRIDTNGMQLLASFDNYDVFKRDFPEYFI